VIRHFLVCVWRPYAGIRGCARSSHLFASVQQNNTAQSLVQPALPEHQALQKDPHLEAALERREQHVRCGPRRSSVEQVTPNAAHKDLAEPPLPEAAKREEALQLRIFLVLNLGDPKLLLAAKTAFPKLVGAGQYADSQAHCHTAAADNIGVPTDAVDLGSEPKTAAAGSHH